MGKAVAWLQRDGIAVVGDGGCMVPELREIGWRLQGRLHMKAW